MIKVLFVCLGNICRSPMAEALFKDRIKKENLDDKVICESRATSRYEIGNPPHPGTQKILSELGISTDGMYSEQIKAEDFFNFDYIIGMDRNNVYDLNQKAPIDCRHKIRLFINKDIPDPYYTGDFNETKELILKGIEALITEIKKNLV